MVEKRYTFVTYDEIKDVRPILYQLSKEHKRKEVREAAHRILLELKEVSNQDYAPMPGYQVVLDEKDYEILKGMLDRRY